ncbi:hypothetical protein LJC52_00350 [Bacteroidales bacterium OttesenSCG-928-A17]|nr:hypothetical protein [Bacteroidales bacterium OttesenSCG-928-A17]
MEERNHPKQELPNANAILILGISSLVGCCFSYGLIGLVCSIIALVMAKSAEDLYQQNPGYYTESSYKNMGTGKTCATISLILSILTVIATIVGLVLFGTAVLSGAFLHSL